ncbi:MAG: AMP-binding protein [Rhizobiales bacterium]|nr:AMP-binding protein [Hyphomicrobiales bacterium]
MGMQVQGSDNNALSRAGFRVDAGRGTARIEIPAHANIAADTVGKHAAGPRRDHLALVIDNDDGGPIERWTYGQLDEAAGRLARGLARLGVTRGQPVAVHTGQSVETAIAHLAIYRLGAVVVTLSELYGPETVRHALGDCGARFVITRAETWAPNAEVAAGLAQPLRAIWCGTVPIAGGISLADVMAGDGPVPSPVATRADEPALLMYTSGSTGLPKGLLHGHRILHAYMPTISLFFNLELDEEGLVFWTPADWAWVGGLLDLLLPAWWCGHTVIASRHRYEAEWAFSFMDRHAVTHAFITPTGLKRLAEVADPRQRHALKVRTICTGGESLPGEIVRWCNEALGAVCNEFYGLTEFNHLVGNCAALYPARQGSMGKAYPGHGTTLVDEEGNEVGPGQTGEIVAPVDDPTLFLGYWGQPGIPEGLRLGRWLRTRDLARRDEDGYYWYQGRGDDLIKSAGYRIGPAEVEDCLVRHPAVAEAAVVASPDAERGAVVKAFVRLVAGARAGEALTRELQEHVKRNLAAYKYPRRIEYVDSFPLTSSGKIRRGELRRLEYEGQAGGGKAPTA